jgi:hypothetical protein
MALSRPVRVLLEEQYLATSTAVAEATASIHRALDQERRDRRAFMLGSAAAKLRDAQEILSGAEPMTSRSRLLERVAP